MTDRTGTILFAGGGTGGHLFPALAVAERLREREAPFAVHFACSDRELDARFLRHAGESFTPLSVKPLPARPQRVIPFVRHYVRSVRRVERMIHERNVAAVVAMGGFASAPAVAAARKLGIPSVLVNLDAVPGKANRGLGRRCDRLLSVYETDRLPAGRLRLVGLPVRRQCVWQGQAAEARQRLGLAPDQPVLLVTGASQGAASINELMMELIHRSAFAEALAGWQILHLAGRQQAERVEAAYRQAGFSAKVTAFCDEMGAAWGAAELAISRAGAGSVAEIAVNRVPAVFLPYPHHRDQHQKRNAAPLAEAGGAAIFEDAAEPAANADRVQSLLIELLTDETRRAAMRAALADRPAANGADAVAEAVLALTGG